MDASLLDPNDRDLVEMVLKYIEDGHLRRWSLPDCREFNIGLSEWRSQLNCLTNPYMYEQLLEISAVGAISKGKHHCSTRQKAANKLLDRVLKVRLGRGFYGECLGVEAHGNSDLSDELGKQLRASPSEPSIPMWHADKDIIDVMYHPSEASKADVE